MWRRRLLTFSLRLPTVEQDVTSKKTYSLSPWEADRRRWTNWEGPVEPGRVKWLQSRRERSRKRQGWPGKSLLAVDSLMQDMFCDRLDETSRQSTDPDRWLSDCQRPFCLSVHVICTGTFLLLLLHLLIFLFSRWWWWWARISSQPVSIVSTRLQTWKQGKTFIKKKNLNETSILHNEIKIPIVCRKQSTCAGRLWTGHYHHHYMVSKQTCSFDRCALYFKRDRPLLKGRKKSIGKRNCCWMLNWINSEMGEKPKNKERGSSRVANANRRVQRPIVCLVWLF